MNNTSSTNSENGEIDDKTDIGDYYESFKSNNENLSKSWRPSTDDWDTAE